MLSPIPPADSRALFSWAATRSLLRPLPLLALLATTAACAAATASQHARTAEQAQDYDRAIVEYTKSLRLDPNNADARLGLERAKMRSSTDHFQKGRRLSALGKYDQALVEFELAAELNPTNGDVDAELKLTRSQLRNKIAVAREGKTRLETLVERSRAAAPPGMDLPAEAKMPTSLIFRDASSREVFLAIARFANLSLVFDSTFRDTPVTVDLRNASLEDALNSVSGATRSFFRVTAPRTIMVVPDTPTKRREYEEQIVRTFYLSNADLKETMDLLRIVLDARRISPITATNALTIQDTPEHIAAAGRLISAIDKARSEVIIDVELLEVDRTKLQEYGLQIASSGSPGLDGAVVVAPGGSTSTPPTLQNLMNLTQSDVLLANLPALYYRLLKSDGNTRILASPQLRTSDGLAASAAFGDRVPIPVTTFAPIATGGTPQQPITSFQYQNIGVNIDITPRTHHDDDVSLALKVAVSSISGTGFGGLPTFGNREVNTVIRLKDGETNMLAGLIRDDERRVVDGIPGLSDIPGIGKIFTHSKTEATQTDIILTLTPHIIRVLDLNDEDLRAFRIGHDTATPFTEQPTIFEPAPARPAEGTPPAPAAPAPAPAPAAPVNPAGPILPGSR